MFDQQAALEFVKQNIRAFRGDPDSITIMGDGAGSVSVGMHLISPVTKGKGREFHPSLKCTVLRNGFICLLKDSITVPY
jgi:hypothetical protein